MTECRDLIVLDTPNESKSTLKPIKLGFFELQLSKESLHRRFLPSKAGGQPAWLDPVHIPEISQLTCSNCGRIMRFVLQIYAPLQFDHAFHRTIFLFACERGGCLSHEGSKAVFSNHLPEKNFFYPNECDLDDEKIDPEELDYSRLWELDEVQPGIKLCFLCGFKAGKVCSKCHKVSYCSRMHQKKHWVASHSDNCGKDADEDFDAVRHLLFPQYEIVVECERFIRDEENEFAGDDFTKERNLLKSYQRDVKKLSQKEKEEMKEFDFGDDIDFDPAFDEFQTLIKRNPDQCIRYQRYGQPLWVSSENQLDSNNIPFCKQCGNRLIFEFQVLPQVLHYLSVDGWNSSQDVDLDWGCLVVYTCPQSCQSHGYQEEFVYYQRSPATMQN